MENEIKLLPMPTDYSYHCSSLYNLPPTKKEGARKVIITRRIYYPDGRLMHEIGTKGVVIPIWDGSQVAMFRQIKEFFENYSWWNKSNLKECRTDRAYDFFQIRANRKTKKMEVGHWHTHISLFDFQYIDEQVTKMQINKEKALQLNLIF